MDFPLLIAEVMDKEPSLNEVWFNQSILCVLAMVVCFFLATKARWFFLSSVPVLVSLAAFSVGDVLDPFVGTAIGNEAGAEYVQGVCLGAICTIGLPIVSGLAGAMVCIRSTPSRVALDRAT